MPGNPKTSVRHYNGSLVNQLLTLLPGGVVIASDSSCNEMTCNSIASDFLRITPEQSPRFSVEECSFSLYQGDREIEPSESPIYRAALHSAETVNEELRFVWPDGVVKHCVTSAKPLYSDDGEVVGAIATIEDITAQKERRSDGELHYLFNAAKDIIAIANVGERRFIRANPAVQQILGYTPEEFTSKPFNTFFHPDDVEPMNEHRRQILQGIGAHSYLNRYRCRDDTYRWLSWTTVLDETGTHSYSIARDITEQREMEQELQRLDLELHQLYHMAEDIIGIADIEARRFIRINPAVERILGYSPEELTNRSYGELFHPDDLAKLDEQRNNFIEQRGVGRFLVRYRAKDESYKWVSWVGVLHPENKFSYCIGRDVTQQIETEQRLHQLDRELHQLYAASPDIIGIADRATQRFVAVNPAVERILGYTPEEFISQSYGDIVHPDDSLPTSWTRKDTSEGDSDEFVVCRLSCKDGTHKWISWTGSYDAESGHTYAIGRDITVQKGMEREMSRLDRLNLAGELAASISHEIRNPLTTVRGYLQLMVRNGFYRTDHETIRLMIDELDRANSIISEFLSVAKTKAIDRRNTSLNEPVTAMLPLIRADAVMTNHRIIADLQEVPDISIDPKEIRQLILNLTRNGLEAMENGGNLTIRTYATDDVVVLAISDQGHGISEHVLERMYDPFFTSKPMGTGLGLSVCHRIAEQHNATIKVDTSGKGTTFSVVFPLPTTG